MKTQVIAKDILNGNVIVNLNTETGKWQIKNDEKEYQELAQLLKAHELTIAPFTNGKEIDTYIVEKILQRFPMLAVGWNPCPEMAVINSVNRPFEPALRFVLDHEDYFVQKID